MATDVSEEMLAQARSDSVTLCQLNVTKPSPFKASRFDAVVASLVLEHVEALGLVFQEARRTLRDGGTFSLAELHPTRQFGGIQPRLLTIRFGAGPSAAGS